MFLLGSSALLAQPYGYGPYGGQGYYNPNTDYYNQAGEHIVCGRNLAHIINYIIDPATGMTITREQYQARYPWTDLSTWTYDCGSNLWTDHTAQTYPGYYASQPPYYDRDRNRNYERDRSRERDRERDRARDRADR